MLAVLKPDQLKRHLKGRGVTAPQRTKSQYLEYFQHIWGLQSYLLSEADRSQMDIITNDDKAQATTRVMRSITKALSKHMTKSADQIFTHLSG